MSVTWHNLGNVQMVGMTDLNGSSLFMSITVCAYVHQHASSGGEEEEEEEQQQQQHQQHQKQQQ